MRIFQVLFFMTAISTGAICSPGGVLEKVTIIQVDPTVVEQPDKVTDSMAPNLVRFNLRAAIKDAHLEEGSSPVRAHIVLEKYTQENATKKLLNFGSGKNINNVDARLVIQDVSGKELANVQFHIHGSVAFTHAEGSAEDRPATSDFEQRLVQEIERLK
jgi:hypothetical protein